jgi:hypothetical protein
MDLAVQWDETNIRGAGINVHVVFKYLSRSLVRKGCGKVRRNAFPLRPLPPPREGILKLLWSPGIESKESIPPAYIAWRAGTTTQLLLGS